MRPRIAHVLWLALALATVSPSAAQNGDEPAPVGEKAVGQDTEADDEPADDEEPRKGFLSQFKDPEDGKFDVTAGGEGASGIIPIAIPFNEPAVGLGLAAAVAYFHPVKNPPVRPPGGPSVPPTTTFAGGAVSDNGTWALAAGHAGIWKEGRVRYLGVLAYASANLDFYGIGNESGAGEMPVAFNIEGGAIVQQAMFQLGKSRFFVGGSYLFASADTTFDIDVGAGAEGSTDNAGLTVKISYDSRDTVFTPNSGTLSELDISTFASALGGDFDYGGLDFAYFHYFPLVDERLVLGVRFEYKRVGNDAPFYAMPWVSLRGIPAFRYLGNYMVTSEIEPLWKIDKRWSVLAFAGVGRAALSFDRLQDAERAYNYGGGFRYLLSRKLGLAGGIDIARGPEETATYIIFGSAW